MVASIASWVRYWRLRRRFPDQDREALAISAGVSKGCLDPAPEDDGQVDRLIEHIEGQKGT